MSYPRCAVGIAHWDEQAGGPGEREVVVSTLLARDQARDAKDTIAEAILKLANDLQSAWCG